MFLTSRFWYINKDIHRFQKLGNEVLRILCWKQILDEMNKSLRSAHSSAYSTAYSTAIQMENLYNFIFTSEIEAAVLKRRLTLSLGGTIRWPGVPSWIQWSEQSTYSALFPGCGCHVTGMPFLRENLYPPTRSQRNPPSSSSVSARCVVLRDC